MSTENLMQDEDFVDKQTSKAAVAYIAGEIADAEKNQRNAQISGENRELAKAYFDKYKTRNSIVRNLAILLFAYTIYFFHESSNFISMLEIIVSNITLIALTALIFMFNEKEYVSHLTGDKQSVKQIERVTYAIFGYVPKYEISRIIIYEFFLNSIIVVAIISGKELHIISNQAYSILISVVLVITNIIFMSFFRQIFMKNIK